MGKQTIYRWWPSKGAVVFDAVLGLDDAELSLPDTGDLEADLKSALRATVAELNDPRVAPALRALRTAITHDPQLAADLRRADRHAPLPGAQATTARA